jgi:3-hydroxyacyl-[acyl-carrier-protein] dehydratase
MRWMWIDRIVEVEPGQRLVAIKNVSLAEEHLHDHFPADGDLDAEPIMPAALMIEGMAQTAGILVGSARDFKEKVILAKIVRAGFERDVFAGDSVRYEAHVEHLDAAGAATSGTVSRRGPDAHDWEEIGKIDLLFSHVDQSLSGVDVPKHNFVFGENLRIILQGVGLAEIPVAPSET